MVSHQILALKIEVRALAGKQKTRFTKQGGFFVF